MAKKVLILSGAGLSAESGISTFRDSDGYWEKYDVMQVCSTQGWINNRALVTQFYNDRRYDIQDKFPNLAHHLLAKLEKRYPNQIYNMTQNVDNLLEKAGCQEVVHLHGTLSDLRCEECSYVFEIGYEAQNKHDSCPKCGSSFVRHNVVMFGEAAPEYETLYRAIEDAELFVAIGTSGQVIDITGIANTFEHSILVNPKQEIAPHCAYYIDDFFEYFIQKKASLAVEELEAHIVDFLTEEEE